MRVRVKFNFEIPANKEITALVPERKRLTTITQFPYLRNHSSALFRAEIGKNENFGEVVIVSPNFLPRIYIVQNPAHPPNVEAIATETKSTVPIPTSVPQNTIRISLGDGGKMFSR